MPKKKGFKSLYTFHNFTDLDPTQKQEIFDLRNHEFVRKWMFNDSPISWTEHLRFIDDLKGDNSKIYYFVKRKTKFIGVYSLVNIKEKSGQGGFYLTLGGRKKKLAVEFLFYTIKFIFNNTDIEKIYGSEDVLNKNAFSLNRLFGFYAKNKDNIIEKFGSKYRYGEVEKDDFFKTIQSKRIQGLIEFSSRT